MPLRAYLSDLAAWPGDALVVHASDAQGAEVRVRELLHSDPNPDGPGLVARDCDWGQGLGSTPSVQPALGSFGTAEDVLPVDGAFTVSAWVWPTDLSQNVVLLSWLGAGGRWVLSIEGSRLTLGGADASVRLDYRLRERTWNFLGVAVGSSSYDQPTDGLLFASVWGRTGGPFLLPLGEIRATASDASLWLGTADSNSGRLDGRVAGLKVHHTGLDSVELMSVMNGYGPDPVHEWRFDDRTDPDAAPGRQPGTRPQRLHHSPMRSTLVPGPLSTAGTAITSPGSIHFHRDDTEDCDWPELHRVTIPPDARSGVYSVLVRDHGQSFELPFIVKGKNEVMLLVPTLTWQAYANLGRDGRSWPGLSHYSLHSDGSPVTITTSRKPSQTFSPSARLEVDAGDGFADGENATHLLMADLYAWYWLNQEFPGRISVLDDRELHSNGASALADCRVLVLSAHPEYWTTRMLDELNAFLGRGGNLLYLGGNGLYWVTSLHPTKPHLMEVRRWGGSQTWSIEPTDRLHQFERAVGGLWEEADRPPNGVLGVAFGGFGNGPSMEFIRSAESRAPQWSWVFAGFEGERFGLGSLNSGAGNEFDRFDPSRRTAGNSVVLASCQPSRPDHFGAFEVGDVRAPSAEVRADVVLTTTPAGGLVFSASSITASGCLTSQAGRSFQRIMRNVVHRMLGDLSQ